MFWFTLKIATFLAFTKPNGWGLALFVFDDEANCDLCDFFDSYKHVVNSMFHEEFPS